MYSKILKTIKKYINFLTFLFNRMKFYMVYTKDLYQLFPV